MPNLPETTYLNHYHEQKSGDLGIHEDLQSADELEVREGNGEGKQNEDENMIDRVEDEDIAEAEDEDEQIDNENYEDDEELNELSEDEDEYDLTSEISSEEESSEVIETEDEDELNQSIIEDSTEQRNGLAQMLSVLSLMTDPDRDAKITLRVQFARDCLWGRHLIRRNEIDNFAGDGEDIELCVWRLEARLGRALIRSNRRWSKILAYHVPLICPPMPVSVADQLERNQPQWSEKVVEVILTWLHSCATNVRYCLVQTEKELLETHLALRQVLLNPVDDHTIINYDGEGGLFNYRRQWQWLLNLRELLAPLEEYIDQLVEDAKERLPMDRRFRVNQICDEATVQKLDAGDYGYSFWGTSMVSYRHGVVWEGLHVLQQGHIFAQDITLNAARQDHHQEKNARYWKSEEMHSGPYNMDRISQGLLRLVFLSNPESEIQCVYGLIRHARRITQNAAQDSGMFNPDCVNFQSPTETELEEFMVGIYDTESVRRAASNLILQETERIDAENDESYHIYKAELNDLLPLVASGDMGFQRPTLQASLIVKNPTQQTFSTVYCHSSIIGYNLENNLVVVSTSISSVEALIRSVLQKASNFSWRTSHSPRTIVELVNPI